MYQHISVKIIADSVSPSGVRLTTFELCYPRFIHAEFMTHRMFSRNAQSTRAIPTHKRIERVRENPVRPIRWGKNQKGMVAKNEEVEYPLACEAAWSMAANKAAFAADKLTEHGLHKQWAGRMLEPFDTITVICTATDYENFFALRCAPDAQPEFSELAWQMADLYYSTTPAVVSYGEWHLPYIDAEAHRSAEEFCGEHWGAKVAVLKKISAARCARVSYLNHDGSKMDVEKDIALHDSLVSSGHMTPLEHQATPINPDHSVQHQNGNLQWWQQYRKQIPGEARTFDYHKARKEQGRE